MNCRKCEIHILRKSLGELDQKAEARLLLHLETCKRCQAISEKFSEIDGLFSKCPETPLPPFLKERMFGVVSEAMREDSTRSWLGRFFSLFAPCKPAIAGLVLMIGIGIGIATGWNLAHSIFREASSPSHDLLSLADFTSPGTGVRMDFIWSENNRRTGQ